MHRNDSSATKQPYQEFPALPSQYAQPCHFMDISFMQLQVSSHDVIARHPPVLPYQHAPHVIASILYHVLTSPFSIYHCKCSLNMSLQYPLPCPYKSVFHMSLRGADRSDVAIFCQFSTWMWPTCFRLAWSATTLVCNLLQVNLL